MEVLESSDTRRYSVIFSKSVNKSAIFEEYQHDGMTIRLPLGELLFTVVESFGIMLNGSEQNSNLDSFFSDREYNLTKFFCDFSFDKNEAKRIVQIVNYLETIAISKKIFNHYTLKNLFFTILPREHSFYYLFDTSDRYRIRRISSNLALPFGNSTEYIYEKLSEKFALFSFMYLMASCIFEEVLSESFFSINSDCLSKIKLINFSR